MFVSGTTAPGEWGKLGLLRNSNAAPSQKQSIKGVGETLNLA
jgi:hypothetical protein